MKNHEKIFEMDMNNFIYNPNKKNEMQAKRSNTMEQMGIKRNSKKIFEIDDNDNHFYKKKNSDLLKIEEKFDKNEKNSQDNFFSNMFKNLFIKKPENNDKLGKIIENKK